MASALNTNETNKRFGDSSESDREKIIEDKDKENTKQATKNALNIFHEYIRNKKLGNVIEEILDSDLPKVLERFFTDIRQQKGRDSKTLEDKKENVPGQRYQNTTLRGIRAGINRYLKGARGIDIISDKRFTKMNELFKGILKQNKEAGFGKITHKSPICEEDMGRLNDYFSKHMLPSAIILQQYVQFSLMFWLCRRGRENLTTMKQNTFAVSQI